MRKRFRAGAWRHAQIRGHRSFHGTGYAVMTGEDDRPRDEKCGTSFITIYVEPFSDP